MTRTRPKGSGRWRVKRPAKPPGLMFPSMRDAIMLWWSWGGLRYGRWNVRMPRPRIMGRDAAWPPRRARGSAARVGRERAK
jgi:hypothetical protein